MMADWVGTWASAQMEITNGEDLPETSLSGCTLRQVVRISTGGSTFRLKLSNQYGSTPLQICSVHMAKTAAGEFTFSGIQTITDTAVTFSKTENVSVFPGEFVLSDAVSFPADDLTCITITMKIISAPANITGHTGSRTTSYAAAEADVSAERMAGAEEIEHWYFIAGLDVMNGQEYGAVVCLGDSITDGRGVTTDKNNRWTDVLAERLKSDKETKQLSVLNMGIGGNSVNRGGIGPRAIDRFRRDVLEQSGVKYLIILEGINDINSASITAENKDVVFKNLIASYQRFIVQAHAQGIKVYGGTITPFKGTNEYNEYTEDIRTKVNEWIKSEAGREGGYDGYIDFASSICADSDPLVMRESYQNDHLHPTAALYRLMGNCIPLDLFKNRAKEGEQR